MKYEIKQYKGQTIEYDENLDKFVCDMTIEDNSKSSKRGSLKDLENEIDQFIKANLEFKPFKVICDFYNEPLVKIVTGVRKDGTFIVKDNDSKDSRASYVNFENEKSWGGKYHDYDPELIAQYKEEKTKYDKYCKEYHKKIKDICANLKPLNKEMLKKYTEAFTKS